MLVTAVVCILVIVGGLWPLPQMVNFSLEKKTTKIQSIDSQEQQENIWRYYGMVSTNENEEIKSSSMDGPLLKIGDEIEFYDIPGYFPNHVVLEHNGNDVREIYDRPIVETKESNGDQKVYLVLYLVLFSISHGIVMYITKKKDSKKSENNYYYQVGRLRESIGRLIWKVSSACYIFLLLFVLTGIGKGIWLNILIIIAFLAVHTGFLIVTIYRNACMICNSQNIQIRYVNGCSRTYQLSDIGEISEKKNNLFILKVPQHKVYIWIRNENQKSILNEIQKRLEG